MLAKSQIDECPKCFLTQVAMEMFVFDSSNYERCNFCYRNYPPECSTVCTWAYALLQAVADMAEESLCYPNSKLTKWTFIYLTLRHVADCPWLFSPVTLKLVGYNLNPSTVIIHPSLSIHSLISVILPLLIRSFTLPRPFGSNLVRYMP